MPKVTIADAGLNIKSINAEDIYWIMHTSVSEDVKILLTRACVELYQTLCNKLHAQYSLYLS